MMRFTLATGLRESNVTQLAWSHINLPQRQAWIHADLTKSKRSIAVSLNDNAMAILRRQVGKNENRVFTYKGDGVSTANTRAWRNALEREGIKDFRWHDLRHTWASWHAQSGTPLHVLQELGGWSSSDMVRRYAHLSQQHLASYADNVCEKVVTNWSHSQKSPANVKRRRA